MSVQGCRNPEQTFQMMNNRKFYNNQFTIFQYLSPIATI
jgi:hypothetical protein